jgi:hypothetical protein
MERANELIARQLVALDKEEVHFVEWLLEHTGRRQNEPRRSVFGEFLRDTRAVSNDMIDPADFDRLGKWVGYLVFFGVVRGDATPGATTGLSVDRRHVSALSDQAARVPSDKDVQPTLLEAYARAKTRVGSQLYIPISLIRDELGEGLQRMGILLTDTGIDAILRRAPDLLADFTVTFSPFSGPARGGMGLAMQGMYAGFISIRPRRESESVGDEN